MARQRNPRGSTGIDSAMYYVVIGGGLWIAYNLALQGKLGKDATALAKDIKGAVKPGTKSTAAATASPVSPRNAPASGSYQGIQGMSGQRVQLYLKDFGGQPVAYDVDRDVIVQTTGGNVYHVGYVFFADGFSYRFEGSGQLSSLETGAVFNVRDFVPGV